MEHPIFYKIDEGTVTKDDFNQLIRESMPESIRDRVRRRTTRNETDSHQDDAGHQQLELPTFTDRVAPKRKPAGDVQMRGRGKTGHRHSARKQKHTMPKRFAEAVEFIKTHVGQSHDQYAQDLMLVEDRYALLALAAKMMSLPNADRDWLSELGRSIGRAQL